MHMQRVHNRHWNVALKHFPARFLTANVYTNLWYYTKCIGEKKYIYNHRHEPVSDYMQTLHASIILSLESSAFKLSHSTSEAWATLISGGVKNTPIYIIICVYCIHMT